MGSLRNYIDKHLQEKITEL